jgi:hypothetical protein
MDKERGKQERGGISGAAVVGLIAVAILGGALALVAWYGARPHPTPIGYILEHVREFDGNAVTVEGTVDSPLNLGGLLKVFDLSDKSGTIKVVTKRGLPKSGETVMVKGLVREVFNVAGMNMTVIMEPQEEK